MILCQEAQDSLGRMDHMDASDGVALITVAARILLSQVVSSLSPMENDFQGYASWPEHLDIRELRRQSSRIVEQLLIESPDIPSGDIDPDDVISTADSMIMHLSNNAYRLNAA